MTNNSPYDAAYYHSHVGPVPYGRNSHWLEFFGVVASRISTELRPRRVLDAGCAWGLLVECLRDRGVDAWGIDISDYAISQVREDMRPYCRVASLTEPVDGPFDLVACIEVLEHLSPADSRLAVERLTSVTDAVLFSSTPSDRSESTHNNVQPVRNWLKLFSEYGFAPDIPFDASFIAPHAMLLRRSEALSEEILDLFCEKLRLQGELSGERLAIAQLWREIQSMRQTPPDSRELVSIKQELARIYSSPAWTIISRYRNWLKSHQRRSSLIWKVYEPTVNWAMRLAGLGSAAHSAPPAPAEASSSYREWCLHAEPSEMQLAMQRQIAGQLSYRPLISVLVPVFRVSLPVVRAMVESVIGQTYDQWELCIAHAEPADTEARAYLKDLSADPRIKVTFLAANLGISGNSNEALSLATGEYLALLDHDDTLAPFALYEVVQALNADPEIDFIYSDKDQIDAAGGSRLEPLFKPDWSPEILLCANYLTHFNVLRAERVRAIGGWRPETDGAQDWDLFLRFIANDTRVHHIPAVLYHWRRVETSVALRGLAAKPYATAAQLACLRDHLRRSQFCADVEVASQGYFRLRWRDRPEKVVSLIVVQRTSLRETVSFAERTLAMTERNGVELIIASTGVAPVADPRIRFSVTEASQSLPARLNQAVQSSRGDSLIFLDDGVEVEDRTWIQELTGPLENPEIGVVGPRLIDRRTGLIRHAGLLFGSNGNLESVFAGEPEEICEQFGPAFWYRNWLAVSGACFSIRKETFLEAGGFPEGPPGYPRLDVDLCLRVRFETGERILYNPFARMLQSDAAVLERRPEGDTGAEFIRRCFPLGDPYFNPNLTCANGRIGFKHRGPLLEQSNDPLSLEAHRLAKEFDITASVIKVSKASCSQSARRDLGSITWFVPEFANPFYGGIHTILRFANHFSLKHGVRNRFAILGPGRAEDVKALIAAAFPELAAASDVTALKQLSVAGELQESDAAVATFWKTAYPVLLFNRTGKKFYFLQDYEPWFYPAGSTSAFAESTYRFGFFGICNTMALRDKYREQGGDGAYFDPCVDSSVFHANGRKSESDGGYNVFCYARPGHSRNCFELVSAAMTVLKRRLGERVRILAAGSDWDPASYGLDGIIENLGMLDYRATGPLYRTCDAGVALMMTAHPSYLPLELMASGALVVSNWNSRTGWFLKDRVNCLLAENSPSALAETIEEGLLNAELRQSITERAAEIVSRDYSQWDVQAEKIFEAMQNQLRR